MRDLVKNNDVERLRVELAEGPPKRQIDRAFLRAVQESSCAPEILDMLLAAGVSSYRLTRGLNLAAEKGFVSIVEKILAYDPDQTEANGVTALYMAAANGHAEVVKLLAVDSKPIP